MIHYQELIEEGSHTEQFILRTQRLRDEIYVKLDGSMRKKLNQVIESVLGMDVEGPIRDACIEVWYWVLMLLYRRRF